ncbi:MAG: helix-turn-helix transcriptional regulator [Saprospiraceae bacterium]|nr:helix-turn-helix transcriptional regulator [Saprospiraceae bacterium]
MEDEVVRRARETIEARLHEPSFSIEVLCKEVHMSRSQLHRRIKQQTGLSTSLFIRKIRLERAAKLLKDTNDNISEIAYQTGIDSPQNFSKYFSLEYGMAPSAYRKSVLEAQKVSGSPAAGETSTSTVQTSYLSTTIIYIIVILSVILGLIFIILYK